MPNGRRLLQSPSVKRFNFIFINPEMKALLPIEFLPTGVAKELADAMKFSYDNDWFNQANIFVEKALRSEMGDNNPTKYEAGANLKTIAESIHLVCSRQRARINDLYIVGHGTRGGMRVHDHWLSYPTVDPVPEAKDGQADYRPYFEKIGKYTDAQSHVYLFACGTGGDKKLIQAVQSLVGCEVHSSEGITTPLHYLVSRSIDRLKGR